MRRLFWLGLGAAAAILVARKLSETKRKYSPAGLADRAGSFAGRIGETLREIGTDIRDGMAEREQELTAGLLGEPRAPSAGRSARTLLDDVDEPEYEF